MTSRRISIIASNIVAHVRNGGYLGTSWPTHATKVKRIGWREGCRAMRLAEERYARSTRGTTLLGEHAQRNFMQSADNTETVAPDNWFIALWPDGTWCDWNERETYLTFMSDDYEKHRVLTYDANGYCPLKTERVS